MYKSQEERNQDLAGRYAGKFIADERTDESDRGLREAFERCVTPADPILFSLIRAEIKQLRVKEALGIDLDKSRVKCARCEKWTSNEEAVLGNKEEDGVWCPECTGCLAGTGYFPDELEAAGMFADELVNGVSEEAVLRDLFGPFLHPIG